MSINITQYFTIESYKESQDLNNYNIKINIYNSYFSPDIHPNKVQSMPKLSTKWRKLTNVIKTISVLNKYDVIPIAEVDIDENINDYKSRLFQHSPLRKKKAGDYKKTVERKKSRNLKSMNHDLMNNILNSFPLIQPMSPKKSSQLVVLKKTKEGLSAKSSPMKNNLKNEMMKFTDKNLSNFNIENSDSESQDLIQVEMNKISIIERIKDYIM